MAPLCIHCAHVAEATRRLPLCNHPRASVNVVDGSPLLTCEVARGTSFEHLWICGPEGRLFARRDGGSDAGQQDSVAQTRRPLP